MVSLALIAYATGLPAFLLIKVLAPGFFAQQDTTTPVKVGIIAVLAGLSLKAVIVIPWMLSEYQAAHVGLAISTALAAWVNAGLLGYLLHRRGVWRLEARARLFILRTLLGCLGMAAILWWLTPAMPQWSQWGGSQRSWQLALLILAGMIAFAVTAMVGGMRPGDFKRDGRHDRFEDKD